MIRDDKRWLTALSLIFFGVAGRIFLRNLLPNTPHIYMTINGITQPVFMMDMFFIVAAVSLFSGLLLGGYYSFIVPLSVMLITDFYYGNDYIFLFTWSGFAFIGLLGYLTNKGVPSVAKIAGIGLGSVLAYDLWTNFGCWLGWYPHTLNGMVTCFILALPFTLWHLLSTVLFVTVLSIPLIYVKNAMKNTVIKPIEKYSTVTVSAFLAFLGFLTIL
ncbi:MAG: DUF6580 family putative transport protein [Candidatus Thermoplasmatota archaeon]|nr:DUF6580 family putative transport protein [Candidatus Thermoplasmatota archaeon]